MKNNELATKLEELVGGVPANTAIEAIDHLIQQVAMLSAKRAKAIIAKIQELEDDLKAEEELYLSSMNRLHGDTPVDTFTRAPMLGHVECITVGAILDLISDNQRVVLMVNDREECNVSDKHKIREYHRACKVIDIYSNFYGGTTTITINCKLMLNDIPKIVRQLKVLESIGIKRDGPVDLLRDEWVMVGPAPGTALWKLSPRDLVNYIPGILFVRFGRDEDSYTVGGLINDNESISDIGDSEFDAAYNLFVLYFNKVSAPNFDEDEVIPNCLQICAISEQNDITTSLLLESCGDGIKIKKYEADEFGVAMLIERFGVEDVWHGDTPFEAIYSCIKDTPVIF